MTAVTLFWSKEKNKDKKLLGVESRGHSGSAPKGEDVVCAAVSALMHALFLGLRDVAKIPVKREVDASIPFIGVSWSEEDAGAVSLLTGTVVLSLEQIASGYAEHVSISEVYR